MSHTESIPLKAFWEAVEQRLAACSTDGLRAILRAMARETRPTGRQAFLEKLERAEDAGDAVRRALQQDALLSDIEDLAEELEAAMAEAEPWEERHDRYGWGEWSEYDDEDSLEPYEEYVEPLVELFDRARAAFDYGHLSLAREAYGKLFEALDLEDEYGRGVSTSDLSSVDAGEACARYLRAVYETEPLEPRPEALFEKMRQVRLELARPRPMLDDLVQISPRPLPDREQFLSDWIAHLRTQGGGDADAWLREAIRLSQGTPGLEALARAEGGARPRAYLDWLTALEEEGRHSEVLAGAREALRALPAELPIRAAVADHLCAAAARLDETEALPAGRWEAFLAQPALSRLLDLWDAFPAGAERTARMRQAVLYLRDRLTQPQSDFGGIPWERDGLERAVLVRKSVLAHASLLAGELETARQIAAAERVLGWSRGDNPQGLVVAFFLVPLSGSAPGGLPPNLAQFWRRRLGDSIDAWLGSERDEAQARLQRAYAERFATVALSGESRERVLSWCLDVAGRRIDAIVGGQHRASYGKAATLTAACAEVLRLRDDRQRAVAWVNEVRARFPRHRAFQAELRTALARMEP
jgi:hypothetical protein